MFSRTRARAVAVLAGVALLTMAALPSATAEEPPVIGPNAESFTLENGLQVVVIPDHRAPVVTHMIWYRVGSADEPPGKSGIAHYLEHLMFKGTVNHPEGEFSRVIGEIGGDENAFTSSDYTAYFQRVARERLEMMMTYEADRMANLSLTEEAVLPERAVILEERAQRLDGEPAARLGTSVDAVLFQRHPYGVPVIGWAEEIAALTRDDAVAFYDRFYTPNNAILVVAGDVTAEEVRRLAEATYGRVPRRAEPPPRDRLDAREWDTPREVTLRDPKVTVPSVRVSWLAPSYRLAEPGEAETLDVLVEALGGGTTSLVYRDLVISKKIATSVGLGYRSDVWDQGTLMAYIVPAEGIGLEEARSELFASIARAVETGLTDEEIARAKQRLEASTIYAQDSQMSMARIFGSVLATGGDLDAVQTWPARIRAVTTDAVRAAAAELDPATSVTGYLRKPDEEQRS